MLVAAGLVVTMIVWMNRVARHLKREIEDRVEAYAQRSTSAAGWGVGAFVFLMVVREGAELVLILRAVELSTAGVQVWIGTRWASPLPLPWDFSFSKARCAFRFIGFSPPPAPF